MRDKWQTTNKGNGATQLVDWWKSEFCNFPFYQNRLKTFQIQSWRNLFFRGCGSDQYIGAILHNHSPFFWKIVNTSIISTSVILILSFHLGLDWMCCAPYLFEWPRFFPRRKIQFCRIESGLLCSDWEAASLFCCTSSHHHPIQYTRHSDQQALHWTSDEEEEVRI